MNLCLATEDQGTEIYFVLVVEHVSKLDTLPSILRKYGPLSSRASKTVPFDEFQLDLVQLNNFLGQPSQEAYSQSIILQTILGFYENHLEDRNYTDFFENKIVQQTVKHDSTTTSLVESYSRTYRDLHLQDHDSESHTISLPSDVMVKIKFVKSCFSRKLLDRRRMISTMESMIDPSPYLIIIKKCIDNKILLGKYRLSELRSIDRFSVSLKRRPYMELVQSDHSDHTSSYSAPGFSPALSYKSSL